MIALLHRDQVPAVISTWWSSQYTWQPGIPLKIRNGWGWPPVLLRESGRCVYIARSAEGFVKVGISDHPISRISGLNEPKAVARRPMRITGTKPIVIISGCQRQHERALLSLFDHRRLFSEWFREDEQIAGLIVALQKAEEPEVAERLRRDLWIRESPSVNRASDTAVRQ